MRRVLAYLLVWSVGTAATVGACWLGLRSVLDATTPRATPFSAAELGRASPSIAGEQPSGRDDEGVASTPAIGPSTTPAGAAVSAAPVATSGTSPTPTGTTGAAAEAVPVSTGEAQAGWEAVPNGRGGTTYRRTFHLQAGDLTFECGPYDVDLIDADLRGGYIIVPTRYDSRALLISLLGSTRTSRVYVAWRDGRPYAEVTETAP